MPLSPGKPSYQGVAREWEWPNSHIPITPFIWTWLSRPNPRCHVSAVSLSSGTEPLVIETCGGHNKLLGAGVKDGLLRIVSTIGQAAHLNLQCHPVFRLAHVGVDVQIHDLFRGRVE